MEKKLQKSYPTDYNLLTAQDLWSALCQMFLTILLKEFTKTNCKNEHDNKKCETCQSKYNDLMWFLG